MNAAWLQFLARRGARIESGSVLDFGDAFAERAATRDGTVLAPLAHLGLIRCGGEDAAAYLHNLLTNDIKNLPADRAALCALCNPKGRMLADLLVWHDEDSYILQVSADVQAAIEKKLTMYVLRSKVKITGSGDEIVLLGISGPESESAVRALAGVVPAEALGVARFDQGCVVRLGTSRFEFAVQEGAAAQIWDRLAQSARAIGPEAWRWLDIAAGMPRICAATLEEFVPQMVNFELLGGVSFTKGCFPGQEVVARTRYLGKIKRRMHLVHLTGSACPAPGADLFSPDLPDQSCGKIVDAVPAPGGGCDALAVVVLTSSEQGDVRLGAADGPPLAFRPLPYPLD